MLTEANLEAHSYRLEFAKELLASFSKVRSTMASSDIGATIENLTKKNAELNMQIAEMTIEASRAASNFKLQIQQKNSMIKKLTENLLNAEKAVKRHETTILKYHDIEEEDYETSLKRRRIRAEKNAELRRLVDKHEFNFRAAVNLASMWPKSEQSEGVCACSGLRISGEYGNFCEDCFDARGEEIVAEIEARRAALPNL